jgi:hypothetical protein
MLSAVEIRFCGFGGEEHRSGQKRRSGPKLRRFGNISEPLQTRQESAVPPSINTNIGNGLR